MIFLQQILCGYRFPALIHAWIASAIVLEWFTSTHGEAILTRMSAGNLYPHSSCCRKVPFLLKTFREKLLKFAFFISNFSFGRREDWFPTPLGPTALVQCATLWAFSRHEINDPSLDPGKYYCLLRLCVGDTVEKCVKNVQKPIFTLKY